MRYFTILDFQYVVILIGLGIVALIVLYVAFCRSGPSPARETVSEKDEKKPVPLLLIFVYVAVIIWALAYYIVIGIYGGPF